MPNQEPKEYIIETEQDDSFNLESIKNALITVQKHKWLVLFTMLLVLSAVTVYVLRQQKIYRAVAKVIIDPRSPVVLSKVREVMSDATSSYWSKKEYYETQYKVIASRTVIKNAVEKLHLGQDLKFLGLDKIEDPKIRKEKIKKVNPIAILAGLLTVEPIKKSRLVQIIIDYHNPAKATLLANTIAESYIDYNLKRKTGSSKDAVAWLSLQLEDLKAKLEQSELDLFLFKKNNNLLAVSLSSNQSIISKKLMQLNQQLNDIVNKRILLTARRNQYKQFLNGKIQADEIFDTNNQLSNNTLINKLKGDYISKYNKYVENSVKYKESHPLMKTLKKNMQIIKDNLHTENKKYYQAKEAEYNVVLETEKELNKLIAITKKKAMEINKKEIEYNKLIRIKTTNNKLYSMVLNRLKETDLTGMLKTNNIYLLEKANVPRSPIKPRVKIILLFGFILSIGLGVGLAFVIEFLDNTIKTQEDIETGVKIPFLGIIPSISPDAGKGGYYSYGDRHKSSHYGGNYGYSDSRRRNKSKASSKKDSANPNLKEAKELSLEEKKPFNRDLYIHLHPKSTIAECCRSIRTNLLLMSTDKHLSRILVTSASPQEGKTTTAVNMAITMAQSGSKVILIDTDMRRPRIHKAFSMSNEFGITSLMLDEVGMDVAIKSTDVPNLSVLPCGPIPPNPAELIHSQKFKEVIDKISQHYDRIVFDSPPVIAVTDSLILGNLVDGVVMVIKSAQTTREVVLRAKNQLTGVNVNIFGAILNDLDLGSKKYGYYYYYYYRRYGYYYGEKDEQSEVNPVSAA